MTEPSRTPRTDALIASVRKAYVSGGEQTFTSLLASSLRGLAETLERELAEARTAFSEGNGKLAEALSDAAGKHYAMQAYAANLLERAERMRRHILTKVVSRLCDVPSGRFHGEWGCGLCGGVGKGPASGERELETIQHEDDCMARPLPKTEYEIATPGSTGTLLGDLVDWAANGTPHSGSTEECHAISPMRCPHADSHDGVPCVECGHTKNVDSIGPVEHAFAVFEDDEFYSEAGGPRELAWIDAMHYAGQCAGKVRIEEVMRWQVQPGALPPLPQTFLSLSNVQTDDNRVGWRTGMEQAAAICRDEFRSNFDKSPEKRTSRLLEERIRHAIQTWRERNGLSQYSSEPKA